MERIWLKQYPAGVPADIDVTQYESLVELLEESFAKFSDRQAFICMDKSISYRDLDGMSAGTPAGYCLSQMRSMLFPLWFTSPASWGGTPVLGSIEQCGGPWQAAARYGRIVNHFSGATRPAGFDPLAWPSRSCSWGQV